MSSLAVQLRVQRGRVQVLIEQVRVTRRGGTSRRWLKVIDLPRQRVLGRGLSHIAELWPYEHGPGR